MKLVNLETGKECKTVKSNKGFKVVYSHGIAIENYTTMRTVQIIEDDIYVIWADYSVSYTGGFMFISLDTGEKFILVRG